MSQFADYRLALINPHGHEYPDDSSQKIVELQAQGKCPPASGDRHVLLRWTNGVGSNGVVYTQIIHLTGGPGNYAFHTPSVKKHSAESRLHNSFYNLGSFSRAQRDQIIQLALAVRFNRRSQVNDCVAWMRDLLEAMVMNGLLHQDMLTYLDAQIPLKRRVPELTSAGPSA